jgi:hypothetical protein
MPRDSRIVAPAIKYNGALYIGPTHDAIRIFISDEVGEYVTIPEYDKGFVDQWKTFYNRFQAGAVAFNAGQTKHRQEHLLSEHLEITVDLVYKL